MNLGRVPENETDDLSSYSIMFSNAKRFKMLLETENPDAEFIIELEDGVPSVFTEEIIVNVPENW